VWPSPAAAELEVRHRNGQIEVRMVDLEATPRQIARDLADAGVDADVRGEPVGPSNVGRLISVAIDGPDADQVELVDFASHEHQAFRIPERFRGRLEIGVGRPARPGERWTASSDAFAQGEPLHCEDVRGRTLADAADELADFHVRLFPVVDGSWGQSVELDDAALAQHRSWLVTRALYDGGRELLVFVDGDPAEDPAPSTC
jgi:hypothetical protein